LETPAKNRRGESQGCLLKRNALRQAARDQRQSGIVRCVAARTARLGFIR
jgi:hypothetical protein